MDEPDAWAELAATQHLAQLAWDAFLEKVNVIVALRAQLEAERGGHADRHFVAWTQTCPLNEWVRYEGPRFAADVFMVERPSWSPADMFVDEVAPDWTRLLSDEQERAEARADEGIGPVMGAADGAVLTKDGVENGTIPATEADADEYRAEQDAEFPADAPHRVEWLADSPIPERPATPDPEPYDPDRDTDPMHTEDYYNGDEQ